MFPHIDGTLLPAADLSSIIHGMRRSCDILYCRVVQGRQYAVHAVPSGYVQFRHWGHVTINLHALRCRHLPHASRRCSIRKLQELSILIIFNGGRFSMYPLSGWLLQQSVGCDLHCNLQDLPGRNFCFVAFAGVSAVRIRFLEFPTRPSVMHLVRSRDLQPVPRVHVYRILLAMSSRNDFVSSGLLRMHTLSCRHHRRIRRTSLLCHMRCWYLFTCAIERVHGVSQRDFQQRRLSGLPLELQAVCCGVIYRINRAN